MPLTKLGERVLAGFRKRYGKDAESRFYASMRKGVIDSAKMERKGASIRKSQGK